MRSCARSNPLYERIACETLDYVRREMTAPTGGFYSAQDADSEGVEGKYYVWTPDEIKAVLGADDARLFCNYYGVTPEGNFEGQNILFLSSGADDGFSEEEVDRVRTVLSPNALGSARAAHKAGDRHESHRRAGTVLCCSHSLKPPVNWVVPQTFKRPLRMASSYSVP